MGIQTAAVLYPVNTTTVDSGTGINIRLLDSAEAAANDDTQTATATHTQDLQGRTFDPGAATSANEPNTSLLKRGWALRLAEDMTPADDTNCNAVLTAGTFTINITVAVNQSGGTYAGGTYAPNWTVALFRYNPSTDTGTLITTRGNNATTWNYTPVTGDLGTFKTIAITGVAIGSPVEFAQGEILLLQIGVQVATIPNPTIGTATWTYTLRVDHANTNMTFAAGQGIASLCPMEGTAAGSSDAQGAMALVMPTVGTAAGSSEATAALLAFGEMVGSAGGSSNADGSLGAVAEMVGTAAGSSEALAQAAAIGPMVGTCDIGAGGDTIVVIKRPIIES